MSLINKMLQDLDARGSGATAGDGNVRAVPRAEAGRPAWHLAAAGALVLALGAMAWFGWRVTRTPPPPPLLVPQASKAPVPPPVPVPQPAAMPAPVAASLPEPEPVPVAEPVAAAVPVKPVAAVRTAPPFQTAAPAKAVPAARGEGERMVTALASGSATPAQQAENAYRRALSHLQAGRVVDALASLEQSLRIEPRHEAARQTLVGLLVEQGRQDEAIEQLRSGLALNPRQPALAMLLARMQIERGANGIETLERSLPGAENDADYRAMLAAALQRGQRDADAVGHFQAALRIAPGNAVWMMGLGMSQQALGRSAEAREAYHGALAAGTLAPGLQVFVEGRLAQVAAAR